MTSKRRTPDVSGRVGRWRPVGRPLIVGHRGAAGHAPENTIASFELAVELGADAVELDVQLSADGHVVALHDQTLDRTTDGRGWVGDFSLSELRRLDAGAWFGAAFCGQRIPTLNEVAVWAKGRTRLVVEIKSFPRPYPGIEARVLDVLSAQGMLDQSMLICFDHHVIRRLRDLSGDVSLGILYACRPLDPIGLARSAGADLLLPFWTFLTRQDVEAAHAAGLLVSTWSTSEPEAIQLVAAAGVDGIATDHPDVARRVLGGGEGEGLQGHALLAP